jgi:hypothetical protein
MIYTVDPKDVEIKKYHLINFPNFFNNVESLAYVNVKLGFFSIKGELARILTEKGEYHYFFRMPHRKTNKHKFKIDNFVTWSDPEFNIEFQKAVIDKLITMNPQPFHPDYVIEENSDNFKSKKGFEKETIKEREDKNNCK